MFSPADQHALYFSNQYLFKTTDGGEHWTRISDDMTRENPGVPPNLDAATAADAPQPQSKRLGVIYTIAPSPVRAPLLWIGTDDGYIHVTQDDGKTWQNVTPRELNAVEQGRDDRGVALRRERGLRRGRSAPARRQRAVHLPHAGRRQDAGRRSPRVCRPASTCRR